MSNTVLAAPSPLADRLGRGLLLLDAVATLTVFVIGFTLIADAPDDRLMVEGWRTLGYFVFAGLWVALALWPRRLPGIWELVLFHKIAVTIYAITIGDVFEARQAVAADSALVITTAIAYVLCRGWHSWRAVTRPATGTATA